MTEVYVYGAFAIWTFSDPFAGDVNHAHAVGLKIGGVSPVDSQVLSATSIQLEYEEAIDPMAMWEVTVPAHLIPFGDGSEAVELGQTGAIIVGTIQVTHVLVAGDQAMWFFDGDLAAENFDPGLVYGLKIAGVGAETFMLTDSYAILCDYPPDTIWIGYEWTVEYPAHLIEFQAGTARLLLGQSGVTDSPAP